MVLDKTCTIKEIVERIKTVLGICDKGNDGLIVFVLQCDRNLIKAWLAQSAERETLNLKVVGSTPTLGSRGPRGFI